MQCFTYKQSVLVRLFLPYSMHHWKSSKVEQIRQFWYDLNAWWHVKEDWQSFNQSGSRKMKVKPNQKVVSF